MRDASVGKGSTHQDSVLEELVEAVDAAVAFSKRWEPAYQPFIFQVALARVVSSPPAQDLASEAQPATVLSGSGPGARLSRHLGVEAEEIERAILFDPDGTVQIVARIDGKTNRELQRSYSLAYAFIKDAALSERTVSIEEIRTLCIAHGIYDAANFATYLKKDSQEGLLREVVEKSGRGKRLLATKLGLDRGRALVQEMLKQ